MCKYCNGSESLYYDENSIIDEVFIGEDNSLIINTISILERDSIGLKINYCPICGKNLKTGNRKLNNKVRILNSKG